MDNDLHRRFYSDITPSQLSLKDLLLQPESFRELPENWDIIVTDIINSTDAFERGLYQEINLIAASSIIAALNVGKRYNLDFPFIFGGDGVTLGVPTHLTAEICRHILGLKTKALKHFKLDLRVGFVSVKTLYELGSELKIHKIKVTQHYDQAVFLGDGLMRAESIVKKEKPGLTLKKKTDPDLEGLECRWQEIPHPMFKPEIISLIVLPTDHKNSGPILANILQLIENTYGDFMTRHPLCEENLVLSTKPSKIHRETLLKNSYFARLRTVKKLFEGWVGNKIFTYKWKIWALDGKNYKQSLMMASDTLKIDGSLKTVMSGKSSQRIELLSALLKLEQEGHIVFGHYVSSHSFLTCFVSDRHTRHIHFLDGKNGGYTQASIELKAKMEKTGKQS